MEDETEMEGVINPSASKALPPIMAGYFSHPSFVLLTNAYKENIPPSPLLSALSVSITYLTVVCSVSVHMIQDKDPSINCSVATRSFKIAFSTYNGDVPISP